MKKASNNILSRIGLMGPVLPYRGGIAQYTTMLHRTLRSQSELLTLSFKRQYPKWLYPGKSDLEPGYEEYHESGVFYVLNSMNPYTWLKVCRLLIEHGPHLVVIPWWTIFWSQCFGLIARYLRYRGIQVMFLCHNVVEHESVFWKVKLTRLVLSQCSTFLVHTREEAARLKALVPKARIAVHPHPIFNQFPPAKRSLPRRAQLELLFFGFVRPYKGLDILLESIHLLKGEDVFLTIAGEWWGNGAKLRRLIEDKDLKGKVKVINRYISEQETAEFFSKADVVVLPYRSATGTGIIPLAYHYCKPVIATRVGGLPEVVDDGVSGRLIEPENPYALAEVIRKFLYTSPMSMQQGVEKVAKQMTWEGLAACILDSVNSG